MAGCALVEGNSRDARFYPEDEYDIAGFTVGIIDKENIIDGKEIKRRR